MLFEEKYENDIVLNSVYLNIQLIPHTSYSSIYLLLHTQNEMILLLNPFIRLAFCSSIAIESVIFLFIEY